MKYTLLCLLSIMILAQQPVELAPNEYDYYRVLLNTDQVGQQDFYIMVNSPFDSIALRCNWEIFETVENSNQIKMFYKDRVKMGCLDQEFDLGLSYNTEIEQIHVQVFGLDDYTLLADSYYQNSRYKAPGIKLVNNKYTQGYKDQIFSVETTSQNIYIELFSCRSVNLDFDQVNNDGTKRSIKADGYNFYDTLNATTTNYQVTRSYASTSGAPQYIIKYQSFGLDKTIPYDQIYVSSQSIRYSQVDDTLKFQVPGIYTSVSYTSIQYFIILGKSSETEYINCYLGIPNSNKVSITYYYGSDNYSPEIAVYYPDQSYEYAVAFAQIIINGVKVTKKLGSTYFYFTPASPGASTALVFLPILISLIGISVILFGIIRYRMKLKEQQNFQQPLISPQASREPQQVPTQQSYLINN